MSPPTASSTCARRSDVRTGRGGCWYRLCPRTAGHLRHMAGAYWVLSALADLGYPPGGGRPDPALRERALAAWLDLHLLQHRASTGAVHVFVAAVFLPAARVAR